MPGGNGLNFGEFMASLRRGSLKHVYLLSGEETYYIRKAKERILEMLFPDGADMQDALQYVEGNLGEDEILGLIETVPFFSDKNVILWQNSSLFREKKDSAETADKPGASSARKTERLARRLMDMPEDSYIIFVASEKADKRRKLYKTIEKYGAVLDAAPVRPWTINGWLQSKLQSMNKTLDRDAEEYFLGMAGMMQQISLEYMDKEFDKLALFTKERRITKAALANVFAGIPEVSVFALLDAISAKNARRALILLRRQMGEGAYMPLVLALLARHVRQLWQAKDLLAKGYRGKALAKPLELSPVIAERLGRAAARFSAQVLKQGMLELSDADYLLKTGQAGGELLEHAVVLLCSEEPSI